MFVDLLDGSARFKSFVYCMLLPRMLVAYWIFCENLCSANPAQIISEETLLIGFEGCNCNEYMVCGKRVYKFQLLGTDVRPRSEFNK